MLLDSASMYFRAFFGVPEITADDGTPVNAVRGFMDFISRLVGQYDPDQLVCCWDNDWRPAWRVELLPTYKTHRVVAERGLRAGHRGGARPPGGPGADHPRGARRLRDHRARCRRLRGGRRDRDALHRCGRPGRRGHRRPGPVPGGRRRRRRPRPLHRPRGRQPRARRQRVDAGEVRRRRGAVRRLRDAARRRFGRTPGRGGDRREDRRHPPQPVRRHGRDPRGGRRPRLRPRSGAARQDQGRRGLPGGRAAGRGGGPRHRPGPDGAGPAGHAPRS